MANPEITIRITPNGVEVEGPLYDRVLCYGMLEAAKDAIREHEAAARKRVMKNGGLQVVRNNLKGLPGQN